MDLKAVLFDLDGTLVNTARDMVGALNRLLQTHDMPLADIDEASKQVSNGGRALVELGFGNDLGESKTKQLVGEFLKTYEQHVCDESHLYDHLLEVLEYCEQNGLKWGVITNKPLELAKGVLSGLNLLDRCAILLGGDSLPVKKPDPVPMLHACMILNMAPSQCVYIGDHERDVAAANAAGMDSAAALWGYIPENESPDNWGAKYMVREPSGLINLIKDLAQ